MIGRFSEAEELQRASSKMSETLHGVEGQHMVTGMYLMSIIYQRTGRRAEAETLLLRALDMATNDTWVTVCIRNYLAMAYIDAGRNAEAEKLLAQILRENKSQYGDIHPYTLTSMSNLAHALRGLGRRASAAKLMSDCADMSSQTLGPDDPDLRTRHEYVDAWRREDREAGALLAEKRDSPQDQHGIETTSSQFWSEKSSFAGKLRNGWKMLVSQHRET
jgi:tetratricopeptide (TPR) repeat protein